MNNEMLKRVQHDGMVCDSGGGGRCPDTLRYSTTAETSYSWGKRPFLITIE